MPEVNTPPSALPPPAGGFSDEVLERLNEALVAGPSQIIEMVVRDEPLRLVLEALLRFIESQAPDLLGSVLLLDPDGIHIRHEAAPSLPRTFTEAIDGRPIGEGAGSCGTAAWRRAPVIVEDIAIDPLWADYRAVALAHQLRACWSTPIFDGRRRVLGTFAIYYRRPGRPTARHQRLIEIATHIAAVAIGHERKKAEIRAGEERYRATLDNILEGCQLLGFDWRYLYLNPAAARHNRRPNHELLGRKMTEAWPEIERTKVFALLRRCMEERIPLSEEIEFVFPDRSRGWFDVRCQPVPEGIFALSIDVTERRQLAEQVRQAQKMEAIGTLASGITHDFNNALSAIIGHAELARMQAGVRGSVVEHLDAVLDAAQRATELVRQILAFSRPQELDRRPIELRSAVEEALRLLRATIPATIEFETAFAPAETTVLADATQVHQIVMNLCTNAAHAMRDRPGRLTVALEPLRVDAGLAATLRGLRPGAYVRLTVSDQGHGMDEATLGRIFEPFFTTKEPGEGTGLGLAVVHGIMQSHEGAVAVESRPGEGTTFRLYFPARAG
jgi:PAS domain S-box-containing protein